MQTRRKSNDTETDKVYVRKGRPRLSDKESFWKGKTDYHTSIVMDRAQYEKIVKAANERQCTVKEMMYRLVEASIADDESLYGRLLEQAESTGKSIKKVLKETLKKGLERTACAEA